MSRLDNAFDNAFASALNGSFVTGRKHPSFNYQISQPDPSSATESINELDMTAPKTAPEFLAKAQSLLAERGKDYDQPSGERSMGKCVAAFNIITGKDLTESEGWLLQQILKDVRQWSAPEFHRDSAEDCISYAALKAEALAGGV